MIKCVIIDDEQHAIDLIRSFCDKIPYLHVIGEFNDPLQAVPFIDKNEVDLVFLDINMQTISGMDFLKLYQISNVILVTAYPEYALDSYEYGVIDYLLKPIAFDRFVSAVQKVLNNKRKSIADINTGEASNDKAHFYIKTDRDKTIKLNVAEVKYIEGLKNYICIHTVKDKIITLLNMKSMQDNLPADRFIRVQKSYIINLDYFDSIEGNMIRLVDTDEAIPLGNTYKIDFLEVLNKNTIR